MLYALTDQQKLAGRCQDINKTPKRTEIPIVADDKTRRFFNMILKLGENVQMLNRSQ